jgi:GcrA cell cycle regulator
MSLAEARHFDAPRGWTEDQEQFLKTEWGLGRLTKQQIADKIGKGVECCRDKAKRLGLPGRPSIPWSDELLETVKRLRKEGFSAREIGSRTGLTRNAILGKMHRIGDAAPARQRLNETQRLEARRSAVKRCRAKKASLRPPSQFTRPQFLSEPLARERILAIPESEWVPFLETKHGQCRAIMADDKRCCSRKVHYRSYCEGHAAIYYHKTARQVG